MNLQLTSLSLQPPLLATNTNRILTRPSHKISAIGEETATFLLTQHQLRCLSQYTQSIDHQESLTNEDIISRRFAQPKARHMKAESAHHATKALAMPLHAQSFDDRIRNRSPALLALCRIAIRMAVDTPGVTILFHEGR